MRLTPNPECEAGPGRPGQPLVATLLSLALMAWTAGFLPGGKDALDAAGRMVTAMVESGERFINDVRLLRAVAELSTGGVPRPAATAGPTVFGRPADKSAAVPVKLALCRLDENRQIAAPPQKKL